LGLAGSEAIGAAHKFTESFAMAKAAGLPIIPHAGETKGPDSIREALELTECKRIGHGVRCVEDPDLMVRLGDLGVVLEVCPSSNVCLGVVPDLASHPLPQLMEAGLQVTINSDDPPMFGTSLTDEYWRCAQTFGWEIGTLRELAQAAANAALVPVEL
jgi:adenosine deaminase